MKPDNLVDAWLHSAQPHYGELRDCELQAIRDFCFVWTIFEAKVVAYQNGKRFGRNEIPKVVDATLDDYRLQAESRRAFCYFQQRYLTNGRPNKLFSVLNRQNAKEMNHVLGALLKHQVDDRRVLQAVFHIVYQFRNNLFHGAKWGNNMKGQRENFVVSTSFMIRTSEALPAS